ncbi:MAG: hypothetical protein NTW87_18750 [Planctomycetota bacterium]|nr:hypothetical protein [Planctomycetota bacterium]
MRSSARTSLPIRHALVLFATAGIAWPACAELDYEFAKALLEREQYSFKTCDMVERLVAQLEQSSATLTDSKLIKATLRRRQAAAASAERAVKLLEEASALYAEILAGSRTFRLYSVAEQESAPLARELLHARLRIIADRPDLAPRLRAEAAAAMEATAKTHAAAAAMAYPAFKPWYEKFIKHKERFPDKPVPREIFDPLRKTFDAWIVADQRYVSASVEQLDCYDDADPAKKALATRLAKHCEDKANDQGLFDFPVLEAWYWFMQGRTYALVQDEAQAGKAWDNVRDMEMTGLDADQKKALFGMKKAILRDLVKLKLKARKYSDVETIVSDAWVNPDYETLWREDAGKSLILDFATALVSPPEASAADLERAIGRLQEMINREPHMADKTPWTCEFARAMADAVRDNGKRGNPPLRLSAPAWYHVAFGFRLKGDEQYRRFLEAGKDKPDAAPHFERACDEYQNAADCYRFAILECRREKTDLLTRLTVEPRAWYELALCYLPSRHYYEAIIACQAMRSTYLPQKREKWLPSQMKAVPQREQPKVAAALAEIEPLLNSAASWMLVAIEENRKAHRNPWDDVLDVDDGQGDPLRNDSRFGDPQYRAAKKDLIAARTLVETARESPATAAQDYEKAETTFVRAAEKFLAVQPSSKAWEPALYQAGAAFAQAEELWASGKIAARSAESRTEKSKALAARALDALGRYEEVVRAAAATSNEGEAREQRLQLQGPVAAVHARIAVAPVHHRRGAGGEVQARRGRYRGLSPESRAPAGTAAERAAGRRDAGRPQPRVLPVPQSRRSAKGRGGGQAAARYVRRPASAGRAEGVAGTARNNAGRDQVRRPGHMGPLQAGPPSARGLHVRPTGRRAGERSGADSGRPVQCEHGEGRAPARFHQAELPRLPDAEREVRRGRQSVPDCHRGGD